MTAFGRWLWKRRLYWLVPMIVILVATILLVVLTSGSHERPDSFIYEVL